MSPVRTPITGPSAWRPGDLADRDRYTVDLTRAHLAAFDAALALNRSAGRATEDIGADDFAPAGIAGDVAAWRDEVLHGRGFVLLRGLSRDRYTADELAAIFWGLGAHLGRAVSQSPMGDRIGHVTDVGGADRRERAYRSSRELTLHTDRCDIIGMLCLTQAMSGGVSGYASAHTIYNDILASRPELLEPLFRGFRYHRRAEQLPGEPPITVDPVPVLSEWEGELSVVYLRGYIEMAAKELGDAAARRGRGRARLLRGGGPASRREARLHARARRGHLLQQLPDASQSNGLRGPPRAFTEASPPAPLAHAGRPPAARPGSARLQGHAGDRRSRGPVHLLLGYGAAGALAHRRGPRRPPPNLPQEQVAPAKPALERRLLRHAARPAGQGPMSRGATFPRPRRAAALDSRCRWKCGKRPPGGGPKGLECRRNLDWLRGLLYIV